MQEHMNMMYININSLGHKHHDHVMTEIGELCENIGDCKENIGGINSNVNTLRDLILNMSQKLQINDNQPYQDLVPSSILLSHHPSSLLSDIPPQTPTPVHHPNASIPLSYQSQVPQCVPPGNLQSMSSSI